MEGWKEDSVLLQVLLCSSQQGDREVGLAPTAPLCVWKYYFSKENPLDCHYSLQLHWANRNPDTHNKKKKNKTKHKKGHLCSTTKTNTDMSTCFLWEIINRPWCGAKTNLYSLFQGFLWLAVASSCYGLKIFSAAGVVETYKGVVSRKLKCTLFECSVLRLLNL